MVPHHVDDLPGYVERGVGGERDLGVGRVLEVTVLLVLLHRVVRLDRFVHREALVPATHHAASDYPPLEKK